ncbi:MAG: 4-hydroxy-tetrahydrodipicolinate synthase [Candidatus Thiodiazotropha sp. (ex Lucinoma aequizonata)]|nr:4-hydroxy-tetrahydrodipicolinate synthase [Candidatus Thiodiazotropha sp. (ex Lucinoma aequizonata)]MCU7889039.1 4-hydroxy-tetrahydrodipicolinate synthase [Candidatus Thiodiazotropha sp. (ex Lucinoma aequizonata)]MCU7893597.1 4-hydroxy-tetrahydrodipicolinate synthase [Candidatus Thiodiazotropha sp. (ex Lucinoma aequizonata)]MCU7897910.1 4-hydroxy-tetrahydrodipicolinate synthase [Candidatus Thiodiazotropha sp. (ex Lucinoma aequizonata)]MCU7903343.1 4-hydroxy-tetrahydrodipicolinate synthase [C
MFHGSMVAMITPMEEDGSLDDTALRKLVEFYIQQGSDAIVAVGTTGESSTLDEQEHCDVIRRVVEHVDGRLPVIAGTGANSTREAIGLTQCAQAAGADACLLVTPYYNKPTQDGLYLHFKAVAEAVEIPQILYNVPGRTACDMLPETTARLANIQNIIGVKEATGDLSRLHRLRELCDPSFELYSGDDATGCEFLLKGGHGVISVTANAAPRLMHEMSMAALAGNDDEAIAIDGRLAGLHSALFVESNPIPIKWAMMKLGLANQGIRLPLTWLSSSAESEVLDAMRQADIL